MNKYVIILSGMLAAGAARANVKVPVPEIIRSYNIATFQRDLNAPLDSLDTMVQQGREVIATRGDNVVGVEKSKKLLSELIARRDSLDVATTNISTEVVPKFVNFNTAISDNQLTPEEANSLLSKVELDRKSVDTYQSIAGQQAYAKVDEVVAEFNAGVDSLVDRAARTRLSGTQVAQAESETGAKVPEAPKEPSREKEQDYTKMDKFSYEVGVRYNNDERLNLALGAFYNLYDELGLGLALEGRLPEKDSDSERNTLATQRNRITGTRLEAIEDRSWSARDYSLELLANSRFSPHPNFSLRYGAGAGMQTTDRDSTLAVAETLYDRNDKVFGKPNVDSDKVSSSKNEWYFPLMIGAEYTHRNVGVGVEARRVKSGKGEVRGTLTYKF